MKDGVLIDASLWTVPLRDAEGHIYGNVAILADLTPAMTAEREYRDLAMGARNKHARKSRRSGASASFSKQRRMGFSKSIRGAKIVLMNAAAEKLTGYCRDELLGQSVEILAPEELRQRHGGHRAAYWQNPVTRPMGSGLELHVQRKDGVRTPVEISLSPVAMMAKCASPP